MEAVCWIVCWDLSFGLRSSSVDCLVLRCLLLISWGACWMSRLFIGTHPWQFDRVPVAGLVHLAERPSVEVRANPDFAWDIFAHTWDEHLVPAPLGVNRPLNPALRLGCMPPNGSDCCALLTVLGTLLRTFS